MYDERLGIIEYFLEYGFNPNKEDGAGTTPLLAAATTDNIEVLALLIKHGGKINGQGSRGFTPLMRAVERGQYEVAHWLLDQGADPSITNDIGGIALSMFSSFYNRKHGPSLERRLSDVFDGTVANNTYTPLMGAAAGGKVDLLTSLVKHTYLVNKHDLHKFTALHYACRNGHPDCVIQLLDNAADPNVRTEANDTPLVLALKGTGKALASIEHLLLYGADASIADGKGQYPSQIAAASGHKGIVFMLIQNAKNSELSVDWDTHYQTAQIVYALVFGDVEMTRQCLKESPLLPETFVELIVNKLVEIFFSAVRQGSITAVKFLLAGGASVDCIDGDGNTPLNIAARESQINVARFLLEAGADIEATTERGYTPIQFAKTKIMSDFLLDKGAKYRYLVVK